MHDTNHNYQKQLSNTFKQYFDDSPEYLCRSPGRVNLIGGHTDYNEGFVLPMALNLAIHMAIKPRQDKTINIRSLNFADNQLYTINTDDLRKSGDDWDEYVKGIISILQQHYQQQLKGFDAVLISDLPISAGLSSSAAFELIIAKALTISNQLDWEPVTMAELAQQAENQWIGVNCGIMDQLVIATGKKDHALFIDCRTLTQEPICLPKNTSVIIMDTTTRRGLANSAYNERRQQCEAAAKMANRNALRDMLLDDLEKLKPSLNTVTYQRAYHVISENNRVIHAKQAMEDNDAKTLGQLISDSHHSLKNYFGVSSEALDHMVDIANDHPACYGARMTGAGFGGCAIALIAQKATHDFVEFVNDNYQEKTGLQAKLYVCSAEAGTDAVILKK
ncbi:MAG: galactokinase [Pseudomonadota bacterium]